MTRLFPRLMGPIAVLVCLLSGPPRVVEASLIGDSVTCGGAFTCTPTTAIVGAGPEFTLSFAGDDFTVDVDAATITVTSLGDELFIGPFTLALTSLRGS